jgi:hypothetical protein
MKTFYSLVYAVIAPETNEKIALGILLSNGKESLFRYSEQKLDALKHFIGPEEHRWVREYMKSVVRMGNLQEPKAGHVSLDIETSSVSAVAEGYIAYLSDYNQNVISFGKPVQIDLPVTQEHHNRLFTALIKEKRITQHSSIQHRIHSVRAEFVPTVVEFFTPELEITPLEFDMLTFPVKLDLMGQNEIPVFARFLDFEKALNHIKSDFFDIDQVLAAIENVKGFIISTEPDREHYDHQHSAWDRFRKKKEIEYLDLSEVEKVRDYAVSHRVEPWQS